jgi:hypothetical protein
MKNFKLLSVCFFVFFLFLSGFSVAHADSHFSFSTDPQSVAVSQPSGPITIHSDTKAAAEIYLNLTSSSPTGQFLTGTGKSLASPHISTGDYNCSIYYKDSATGDFVITANIFSDSGKTNQIASISQDIYIGQPVPGGGSSSGTASTTDDTAASTADQTAGSNSDNSNDNGASSSANSSPASISNSAVVVDFQISAGRDRLTSVGNELLFVVTPTKTQNILSNLIGYTWSFGDGSVGQGASVNHAYKFPGQYSVVVNATASDQMAVDRLTVKVVDPQITLQKIDGGLEVKNNSGAEINLEGWKLVSPTKSFTFPTDTLIPAGHSVTFADETTGINSGDLQLQNPLGKTYASVSGSSTAEIAGVLQVAATPVSAKNLDDISASVVAVAQKLAMLKSEMNLSTSAENLPSAPAMSVSGHSTSVSVLAPTPALPIVATADIPSTTNNIDQSATVFVASSSPGIISRIFSWPIAGINFIRNLFIEK